jgi:hypothetical protein
LPSRKVRVRIEHDDSPVNEGAPMPTKPSSHGQGSYDTSRDRNEAARKFVDSGNVDEAAEAKLTERAALLRAKIGARNRPIEEPGVNPPSIDDPPREPEDDDTRAPKPRPGRDPDWS